MYKDNEKIIVISELRLDNSMIKIRNQNILLLFFLLIGLPLFCFPQKNEIVTFIGKTTNQFKFQLADVYQLKFEKSIAKSINIQTGIRYHSELEWVDGVFTDYTQIIRRSYNSYKVDASIIFLPINNDRFKLKVGLGIDAGRSLYTYASKGIIRYVEKPDGLNTEEYWQYTIKTIPDFGCHFLFSGNYYFKNNLFCSLQILYNQVFNVEEYSPEINRISPLCLSLGIGHRF